MAVGHHHHGFYSFKKITTHERERFSDFAPSSYKFCVFLVHITENCEVLILEKVCFRLLSTRSPLHGNHVSLLGRAARAKLLLFGNLE